MELPNNEVMYMENWKLSRLDGPALIKENSQEWYKDGVPHRENGPARMFKLEKKAEWWFEGKLLNVSIIDETHFMLLWSKE